MRAFLNKFDFLGGSKTSCNVFASPFLLLKLIVLFFFAPFFLFGDSQEPIRAGKEIEVRAKRVEEYRIPEKDLIDRALGSLDSVEFKIRGLMRESVDLKREMSVVPKYSERSLSDSTQLKQLASEWNAQVKEFCDTSHQTLSEADFESKYKDLSESYLAKRKIALLAYSRINKSRQHLNILKESVTAYVKKLHIFVNAETEWNAWILQAEQKEKNASEEMDKLLIRLRSLRYLAKSFEEDEVVGSALKASDASYLRLVNEGKELALQMKSYKNRSEHLKIELQELAEPYEQVFVPKIDEAVNIVQRGFSETGKSLEEMIDSLSVLILCYRPTEAKSLSKEDIKSPFDEISNPAGDKNSTFYVLCRLYIPQISKNAQADLIKTNGPFMLRVEGDALTVYPVSFFITKKKLSLPLLLKGKDLQTGELRQYDGVLLLEVAKVYDSLEAVKSELPEMKEILDQDPFAFLVFDKSTGRLEGVSHHTNVHLSWKGGPLTSGWTPVAREKSFNFFKKMLKEE